MPERITEDREQPQPTRDEDQGGKVNIPTAVVAGLAAFAGGYAGASAGSSSAADTVSAIASAAARLLS